MPLHSKTESERRLTSDGVRGMMQRGGEHGQPEGSEDARKQCTRRFVSLEQNSY